MHSNRRTVVSLLCVLGLLFAFLPCRTEAAGAMRFDFENTGIAQENQYRLLDNKWELSCTKEYQYYPNGTLKTVCSDGNDLTYEGHYDPHGHLMDPSWTFYAGYIEGIVFDAQAVRTYDGKGKLIHFEASCIDFDSAEPYLIKADYTYDSQNRIARVIYSNETASGDPVLSGFGEGASTGYVFSYAGDGSYSVTAETRYGNEMVYHTSFSYDSKYLLIRYDSSSETVNEYDGKLYTESQTILYYYDDDGFLTRFMLYRDGEQTPVDQTVYQYEKTEDNILLCDEYVSGWKDNELEYNNTVTYIFDENGRIVEEDSFIPKRYSYEYPA